MSSCSSYKPIGIKEVMLLLNDQDTYKKLAPYKKAVLHSHGELSPILIEAIEQVLIKQQRKPLQILLALRFCKELMDTHDEDIVLQVQQTLILDEITKIASFQPENKDPDRGKYLISIDSDKEEQKIANSILRICLECIQVWASWYPIDDGQPSAYAVKFKELKALGVEFPKFIFFNVEQVKQVYSMKCSYLQFQKYSPSIQFQKWDEQLLKLKDQLVKLGKTKTDKTQFDSETNKIMIQFKQFLQRASFLLDNAPELKTKIKAWVSYTNFYIDSLGRYKNRQITKLQFVQFWENYEESVEVMDFSEINDQMLEEKNHKDIEGNLKEIQLNKNKEVKNVADTWQSSQQHILTETTFDLICKEKEALIDKLTKEQEMLLNKLEFYKLEYYELAKKTNNHQLSAPMLHLNQSGIQISKKETEPEDL